MSDNEQDERVQAFPFEDAEAYYYGMSLREYFAAKVIGGLYANPSVMPRSPVRYKWHADGTSELDRAHMEGEMKQLAALAFLQAEAMIRASKLPVDGPPDPNPPARAVRLRDDE